MRTAPTRGADKSAAIAARDAQTSERLAVEHDEAIQFVAPSVSCACNRFPLSWRAAWRVEKNIRVLPRG